jgi:hypothetical protein
VPREYLGCVLNLRRYSGLRKTEEKIGHGYHEFWNVKIKLESLE